MGPCRAERAVWGPPNRARRTHIFQGVIATSVLCGFLYHTSLNLQRHLEGKTVFIASEDTYQHATFPPFRFCIWPTWNPLRLTFLGLNISNLTKGEIQEHFNYLTGISEHTTGRQLVEHAGWRVEDLIEEVKVGNVHEVYDSSTPTTSLLWHHSFTPLGPCLTLTVPPSASLHSQYLSIRLRDVPAGIEPCRWEKEGRTRQFRGLEDCPAAEKYCNTSCEWEDFKLDFLCLTFKYLLSTSDVFWINEIKTASRLSTMKSIFVEPFKIINIKKEGPVDVEACYHKCVMASGLKEAKCKALVTATLDEPFSSLCVTVFQQYTISKNFISVSQESNICLDKCKSRREVLKWRYTLDEASEPLENVIRLRLAKPSTLILRETEVYPLSQLLTDTGGGLGLFLGVCALDGWNFVVRVVVGWEVVSRRAASHTLERLGQLFGALLLSMATCVHLFIMGQSYLQQPVTLSASLTLAMRDTSPTASPVTPETLVMERMASRILGCRVSTSSRQDECVKCVLQGAGEQSLPFVSVDDLPLCMADHITFPYLKFTAQKKYVESIAGKKENFPCSTCDGNVSRPPEFVKFQILENSPFSLNSVLCTLGGLLGLYLGLSLRNIRDLVQKTVAKRFSNGCGRRPNLVWLCFTVGVVTVAVAICLLQLSIFIGAHPVYSSTSALSLQEDVLPSVTACTWPPFNIRPLLEAAGLGATFSNMSLITDSKARDAAVALLLQNLPEVANVTDPRVLWDAGAWTDKELYVSLVMPNGIDTVRIPKHRVNDSIFNYCYRYTPDATLLGSLSNIEYIINTQTYAHHFGMYSYVIFSLHYPDEVPLIEPNILPDIPVETVDISAVTKWQAMDVHGVGDRGDCVSRCLKAAFATHLGCRLPSAVDHQDLAPCNMTVFANFLADLWRLRTLPRGIYRSLVGQNQTDACNAACRHGSQTFYKVKSSMHNEETVVAGLSVGIASQGSRFTLQYRFITNIFETMKVHNGYTINALLSDIGGVVGMTLGVSLLSLLLTLAAKIT